MYVLEGRLAGEWAQELVWVTRELSPETKAVIDIEHVHYVDALGEKALHWLNRLGATFVARNAYGVHLCDRLDLHRLAPDSETHATSSAPARTSRGHSSKHKSHH